MEKVLKDLISIIVPVYNAQKVLPRCLNSLLNQTYDPIEIILINDGSTDNSLQICENYAKKSKNIIVISQKNYGAGKARNTALDNAHGEFYMFVDADDYVKNDICEKLHQAMINTGANCAMCGHISVKESENRISEKKVNEEYITTGKAAIHEMYCGKNKGISLVEVWGKLFSRSMWEGLRFCENLYYEDLDIMPFLFYDCSKIVSIPYIGYYYMIYEESASHGKGTDDKRVLDSILIREKHINFYKDRKDNELSMAITYRLLDLILTAAKNGWVPSEKVNCLAIMFRKHWKQYKKCGKLSFRNKLKYELFSFAGIYSFKNYQG